MSQPSQRSGQLLWVSAGPESGRLVDDVAREFQYGVHVCAPDKLMDAIRASTFDVVILEIGSSPREGVELLQMLHERLPRVPILVATSDTSVAVMRAVLERGAADVLSFPLTRQELTKALIKIAQLAARQTPATGEVITVMGARGGLGATTLAVNLACRLRTLTGADVGMVDLDLQRGDVAAFLNLTPTQSIAAIAGARGEIDDIFLHGTLTRHPGGWFVLAAPTKIEEADAVSHEDVQLALRLMRGQFRYTVVDTSRTITGPVLAALEDSERLLVLADLSVPGVRAARRLFELFERLGVPPERLKLVVTRVVSGPVDLREATRTLGREPLAILPADTDGACGAMNAGIPLNGTRQAGLSHAIGELATRIAGVTGAAKSARAPLLRRIFSSKETRT